VSHLVTSDEGTLHRWGPRGTHVSQLMVDVDLF
jgi:hypothetical protein